MKPTSLAEAVADELLAQRAARRPVTPVSRDLAARGFELAYEAQDRLFARIGDGRGRVGGYKIGMGGRTIRDTFGLSEPASGMIAADTVLASGATIRATDYQHLAIECEIAVRMGRPFAGDGSDDRELADCVDAVCSAFEVVDDRQLDYGDIDVFTMIADNGWNAGLVIGPARADIDVMRGALVGRLSINGREIFSSANTDTLLPLDALAWLATHLARRGRRLEAGDWIATGGLTSCFPSPGDDMVFAAGPLEPVHLKIA